jgi:hypothetical protein
MKLSLYLLFFLLSPYKSAPYDSIQDLYETEYQYEEMDNYISEEIQVSRTPAFISRPLKIVRLCSINIYFNISYFSLKMKEVHCDSHAL